MSKRIDLTQFEGMMEGPWELKTRPHGRNGMEGRPEPDYNSTEVRKSLQAFSLITTFSGEDKVNAGYNQYSSIHFPSSFYDSDWLKVSLATARALAAAPDLVAELKICYEAIDVLSSSAIEDAKTSMKLAKKLAKQNRDIEEIIDCLEEIDGISCDEIIGMLRPLLARF